MQAFRSVSLLALASCALAAQATVLDFDAYPGNGSDRVRSYQGFDFTNVGVYSEYNNLTEYGNTYAFPSSANAIYNGSGGSSSFSSNSAFSFQGGYFGSFGQNDDFAYFSARAITIEGYLGGALVGSVSSALGANGLSYVAANFARVDQIRFVASGGDFPVSEYFYADSLSVNAAPTVPGPMAALPFALMALRRRKRA